MEFSKEEWELHAYGNGNFYIESAGRQIATIHYYPSDKTDQLARANAKLCVQAPRLYEALKAIQDEGTRCINVVDKPVREIYDINKVDRIARQAIAKVEKGK